MSHIVNAGLALDLNLSAVPITGNASGTTPMVSTWLKLAEVDTAILALATAVGTGGVWSAKVATSEEGQGAVDLANPPVWPTGTHQAASVTIQMPGGSYRYLQLTFTPNAGSGAVTATFGKITGLPVSTARSRQLGIHYVTTNDVAGAHALDFSGNYDGRVYGGPATATPLLRNTISEPVAWDPAKDEAGNAIVPPAASGSSPQSAFLRLGIFEPLAIRCSFTPASGSGQVRVYSNGKA